MSLTPSLHIGICQMLHQDFKPSDFCFFLYYIFQLCLLVFTVDKIHDEATQCNLQNGGKALTCTMAEFAIGSFWTRPQGKMQARLLSSRHLSLHDETLDEEGRMSSAGEVIENFLVGDQRAASLARTVTGPLLGGSTAVLSKPTPGPPPRPPRQSPPHTPRFAAGNISVLL